MDRIFEDINWNFIQKQIEKNTNQSSTATERRRLIRFKNDTNAICEQFMTIVNEWIKTIHMKI